MGLVKSLLFKINLLLFSLSVSGFNSQEEVHLSLNTTNFIVGETLYFSAFVYSNTTKKLSNLSSILYVEVINENGKSMCQTKVALWKGRASGQIYINPIWQTSTYRVIAHTRWMMNYRSFFSQELLIINPYNKLSLNESFLGNPTYLDATNLTKIDTFDLLKPVSINMGKIESSNLAISVNRTTLLGYSNDLIFNRPHIKFESFEFLPEYQYGLIQGVVKDEKGLAAGIRLNMAIQGTGMQVATTKTDEFGRFWMKYPPELTIDGGLVQVQTPDDINYKVNFISEYYLQHAMAKSVESLLDSLTCVEIIERSINGQIQRAYQQSKVVENKELSKAFIHPEAVVYYLDEYKRFPTVRDTFIELIIHVAVSKSENNYRMNVRCKEPPGVINPASIPLILLDGLIVTSEDILNISPNEIDRIEVLPEYYFLGDINYKGIISVHTSGQSDVMSQLEGSTFPLLNFQDYRDDLIALEIMTSLPHYDSMLFWDPIVYHQEGELIINFHTSRLPGTYEVVVTGISESGKPVNLKRYFKVL